MAPGCKPGGLRLYVGSNPTPSTKIRMKDEGGMMEAARLILHTSALILGFRGRSAMVAH